MARNAFSGDLIHELPRGKIEPYRLWFEYLKFALESCPTRVNRKFYESWGDVESADFDEWFKGNWKRLFAKAANVSIVSDLSELKDAINDSSVLVLKVQRTAPLRRQLSDFQTALKTLPKMKVAKTQSPQFEIESKRSMNLDSLRAMLKFLRLLREHQDIEVAAKAYCEWADTLNKTVQAKKWKRPEIAVPAPIMELNNERKRHEELQKSSVRKVKRSQEYNSARSDLNRFKRKAEKIVSNVARGHFPGEF